MSKKKILKTIFVRIRNRTHSVHFDGFGISQREIAEREIAERERERERVEIFKKIFEQSFKYIYIHT